MLMIIRVISQKDSKVSKNQIVIFLKIYWKTKELNAKDKLSIKNQSKIILNYIEKVMIFKQKIKMIKKHFNITKDVFKLTQIMLMHISVWLAVKKNLRNIIRP